ncbi:ABC transporter substrate-binding protein [Paenibacillus monticola]|uniref:Extracellular solute-binding protein n=1 Tax=Paenibacillus monticola TaxID=2666075 RepID=A0A7X2H4A6_9BACL|nr:ABC transporter substrate-binding protein [Paenibacillus monticola]MRN53267.1 extracellular solute-binding protein [Paenibacillus monticola]
MSNRYLNKSWMLPTAAVLMITLVLSGCGGGNNASSGNNADANAEGSSGNTANVKAEKTKVSVWYLWGGAEGEQVESLIKRFNESQDLYTAEGLSVPDEQKIKVAIAGGDGPDITDSFASNIAQYAEEGIALDLDSMIDRDAYDLSDFIPATLEQGKYQDKFYALPLNTTVRGLYYNKKLLSEAGYTEPPTTSQELYDMAAKLTKTKTDGTIEVLGYPVYPNFDFEVLTHGFGGQFLSADGKTAMFDSDANLAALTSVYNYTKQFGVDNIKKVQASGKWLDPNDPFMTGKQAFRVDGSWLSTFIKTNNIDLDYGLVPIPYLDGHPEMAESGENQSSIFYIANNAKNKEGAWEFMKFMYSSEELATFMAGMGNIPARQSSMENALFDNVPDAAAFIAMSKGKNLKSLPNITPLNDISKAVKEEFEALFNLKQTPEETIQKLQSRTEELLK